MGFLYSLYARMQHNIIYYIHNKSPFDIKAAIVNIFMLTEDQRLMCNVGIFAC